jgi:hypothetical protein
MKLSVRFSPFLTIIAFSACTTNVQSEADFASAIKEYNSAAKRASDKPDVKADYQNSAARLLFQMQAPAKENGQ